MGKGRFWLYSCFRGHRWPSGGAAGDSRMLHPPTPQMKVAGNDGSQGVGGRTGVPTCYLLYLLRGVSGDPFFSFLGPQSRRPIDLSMPTFRGSQGQESVCRSQFPTIMFLDPFAEGCIAVVLCGFWVAPFFQVRAPSSALALAGRGGLAIQSMPLWSFRCLERLLSVMKPLPQMWQGKGRSVPCSSRWRLR